MVYLTKQHARPVEQRFKHKEIKGIEGIKEYNKNTFDFFVSFDNFAF